MLRLSKHKPFHAWSSWEQFLLARLMDSVIKVFLDSVSVDNVVYRTDSVIVVLSRLNGGGSKRLHKTFPKEET